MIAIDLSAHTAMQLYLFSLWNTIMWSGAIILRHFYTAKIIHKLFASHRMYIELIQTDSESHQSIFSGDLNVK